MMDPPRSTVRYALAKMLGRKKNTDVDPEETLTITKRVALFLL